MRLRFADCVLDLRARQLERQGKIVPLEPKVYELLETLIKRRPAVVTNNELDELLWPQVYVARTSLTRLVSELRAALGDTPHGSHVIRTVYKTGYAFCAEVTCVPSQAASPATIELVWKKQPLPLGDGERSEEHTSELQSRLHLVCRLLLEKKKGHSSLDKVSPHIFSASNFSRF